MGVTKKKIRTGGNQDPSSHYHQQQSNRNVIKCQNYYQPKIKNTLCDLKVRQASYFLVLPEY